MNKLEQIKQLHQATNSSLAQCKAAVEASDGSYEDALNVLQRMQTAQKTDYSEAELLTLLSERAPFVPSVEIKMAVEMANGSLNRALIALDQMQPKTIANILNRQRRSEVFVSLPNAVFGDLMLDVWSQDFTTRFPQGRITEEQEAELQRLLQEAKSSFSGPPSVQLADAIFAIVKRYPLSVQAHLWMAQLSAQLGNRENELYHLSQSLVLSPVYQRFVALGELLGQLNRVRDSYIVLREIYTLRKGAPASVATSIGFALTVTLGRIRRYEEMSEVSRTMIAEHGFESRFAYQHVLALLCLGNNEAASECYHSYKNQIQSTDPLRSKFLDLWSAL